MHNGNTWDLPFGDPAELELHTDWGSISMQLVESGGSPRVVLTRGSTATLRVDVNKVGDVVRVTLEPQRGMGLGWFGGGWDCHVDVYVPRNVRAHVQTSAGSIAARDLEGCELGIKASAGKIDLTNVHGLLHLAADAGSINGRGVGGHLDIETQAGSVRLEVDELKPGEHRIRATMGSVRLEMARGMDVAIETRTSLGSIRNKYPSNASASARLLLSTEMGEVRVEEAVIERRTAASPSAAGAAGSRGTASVAEAAQAITRERSDPELDRVLKMVESGEISAQEADELLQAMGRV